MSSETEVKKHYEENFDPKSYRERLIDRDGGKFQEEENFFFESMKKIFDNEALRGETLLDVGSGPTVHNLVPACFHFSRIVLSDFVETNRKELWKWLKEENDALDWTRLLTLAVKVQGFENVEEGISQVKKLIRKNVKDVVHCDVLADPVVPPEYDVPYDVVMTSLTIESAARNYEEYKKCLRKLNNLTKTGGHLVMKGVLKGTPWSSGHHVFPYLELTKQQIHDALLESGFADVQWYVMPRKDMSYGYTFEACYCLSCTKNKDAKI